MLYNSSGLWAPRVGRGAQAGGTTRRWRDLWEQRRSSRSGLRPRRLLRAQKQRQRVVQAGLTGSRIEPARIELAAQPGQLALGQLAGGVDGADRKSVVEGKRVSVRGDLGGRRSLKKKKKKKR